MKRIATIGFFDGLHRGHQFVLSTLLARAEQCALQPLVITFTHSPYLPDNELLLPVEERIHGLQSIVGKDNVCVFEFTAIRHYTAREFMRYLRDTHNVAQLLMGFDQRFGSDQLSRFADYQTLCAEIDVEAFQLSQTVNPLPSSRSCRHALKNGQIEALSELLGYSFQLTGKVIHGRGIGHTIGFPTANLQIPTRLLPKAGVYVVVTNKNQLALLNIGTNPTVHGKEQTAEVHIIDYQGDMYGETMTISLLHYLREQQTFPSLEVLKEQIKQDIQHAILYDRLRKG